MKNFLFAFFISSYTFCQPTEVLLNNISKLDEESIHIEILTAEPKELLKVPNLLSGEQKYLTLFYSWDTSNDEKISILVRQSDVGDTLYVDLNNDEDLTNDGPPLIFLLAQNSIVFDIVNSLDIMQNTRLALYREPVVADSFKSTFLNESGDLLEKFVFFWKSTNDTKDFYGKKRTFFFDDRMGLRKNKIILNNDTLHIGLFDYTNNGLFTDEKDLLLVDLNKDDKLDYLHEEEIFKLNDIFKIGQKNYRLSFVDRYGKSLILETTDAEPTKYFTRWEYEKSYNNYEQKLNQEFWEYSFKDIHDNVITMQDFKGKYLLLNFWGEWCMPCRDEIPDLVESYNNYFNEINMISFLKTYNLESAKELINKNRISWPQIILPGEIEQKFKILGFPTNILIFPDGEKFILQGQIRKDFFDLYIK